VQENRELIHQFETTLQPFYSKKLNVNIASLRDGVVREVFKGTADEANNSLFSTYALHEQRFDQQIERAVPRDPGIKNLRAMRSILSLMSRTQYRMPIKNALRDSAVEKHSLLKEIRIDCISDIGHKNIEFSDFLKSLAFQMGQSYLLNTGIEVYTKRDIAEFIPYLRPILERRTLDSRPLDEIRQTWLNSFDPATIPQYEDLRG
jgi:hypothetical protein